MHARSPRLVALALLGLAAVAPAGRAQPPSEPDVGYLFPAGGRVGGTVPVRLGVYDWTPDLQYFVSPSQVRLEVLGPPTRLLPGGPPFFLDQKAFNPLPLPRELPARLVLPADLP